MFWLVREPLTSYPPSVGNPSRKAAISWPSGGAAVVQRSLCPVGSEQEITVGKAELRLTLAILPQVCAELQAVFAESCEALEDLERVEGKLDTGVVAYTCESGEPDTGQNIARGVLREVRRKTQSCRVEAEREIRCGSTNLVQFRRVFMIRVGLSV